MNIDDYDSYMVETKDSVVTKESLVCISPYNTKTGDWLSGLMEITSMEELLRRNKKLVTQDGVVKDFFEEHFSRNERGGS